VVGAAIGSAAWRDSAASAKGFSAASALCFFMKSQARPKPAAASSKIPEAVRATDLIAASLIDEPMASSEETTQHGDQSTKSGLWLATASLLGDGWREIVQSSL
jgi:hypothetical protein